MRLPLLKVTGFISNEVIPCSLRWETNLDFGSLCPGRDEISCTDSPEVSYQKPINFSSEENFFMVQLYVFARLVPM